jgi:hypothetical protein
LRLRKASNLTMLFNSFCDFSDVHITVIAVIYAAIRLTQPRKQLKPIKITSIAVTFFFLGKIPFIEAS